MTRANGSLDFFSSEYVVGTALMVDRMYFGGQFACSEGVTLDLYVLATARCPATKECLRLEAALLPEVENPRHHTQSVR